MIMCATKLRHTLPELGVLTVQFLTGSLLH